MASLVNLSKRSVSCYHDGDHVKNVTGCCDGVSGYLCDEHSILCFEFWGQSPQRLFNIAMYRKDFIPSGETLSKEKNDMKIACEIMNVEEMSNLEEFKEKWDLYVEEKYKNFMETNERCD
jgi:hypothetical protein